MKKASISFSIGALALAACSATGGHDTNDGALGQARVAVQAAPDDVHCVKVTAAGSTVTTLGFDVTPGESSVFELNRLPLGVVAFSAAAFPVACSEVADADPPYWIADPVESELLAGVIAEVTLVMHRDGRASVGVEWDEPGQGGAPGGGPVAGTLLFSEYVEGSSTYKALEISALVDSNLDGCRVATYFNGATTATDTALAGALAAGESHVICSSALAGVIGSCDQTAGLTFNGDDAIALECAGVIVDVIGQIGFDPGTAWGSGELSLVDHTLRRSCSVQAGDTDGAEAFDPATEWSSHALDTFDDLGSRTCP